MERGNESGLKDNPSFMGHLRVGKMGWADLWVSYKPASILLSAKNIVDSKYVIIRSKMTN